MTDFFVTLSGECSPWPSKADLVRHLRAGGLRVSEDEYSVRVEGETRFIFRYCCGDCGDASMVEADAGSAEPLLREAKSVSSVLALAGIRHQFDVYDSNHDFIAYLHHDWPSEREA
ncbi:hypothetical protein [Lysobacter silvisoli]|uniref:Uncharacterized protein n=1 Tax=Lysobacter silvisoli TaxID=2293254 RepID=A0A371K0Z9_9GAMM|nr:hypothetical protein [Lysobacter silvisoli]RDZ27540.1 hypothetical protein DX914_15070 [Lysobacter silvisoli]